MNQTHVSAKRVCFKRPIFIYFLFALLGCSKSTKPAETPTSSAAHASHAPDTAHAPKSAADSTFAVLSPEELESMRALVGSGALVLVENTRDEVPAVHLVTLIPAPPSQLAALLSDPVGYRRNMPAVDDLTIRGRHGESVAYDWLWNLGTFTMRGSSVVTRFSGKDPKKPEQNHRVELRYIAGDLGVGRAIWKIEPAPGGMSWANLSIRVDLRQGHYWIRELAQVSRSFSRSTSVSMAVFMALGLRNMAKLPLPPRRSDFPEGNWSQLGGALRRGDMAWVELLPSPKQHVLAIGRMGVGKNVLRHVMASPRRFGAAMMYSSMASARSTSGSPTGAAASPMGATVQWGVSIPLLGSSGTMFVTKQGEKMHVEAVEGAMKGGIWDFEAPTLPWGEGMLVGKAVFDPADGSWITRQLVKNHPYWSPGLAGASQILAIRAIRQYVNPSGNQSTFQQF